MAKSYYGKLLSVTEAMAVTHLARCTIMKYIHDGKLPATNLSYGNKRPRWGIREDDLEQFVKHKEPRKIESKKDIEVPKPYKCRIIAKDDARLKMIRELKAEMSKLSEELLIIAARLEELSI